MHTDKPKAEEHYPTHCDHGVSMDARCNECNAEAYRDALPNETPWGETHSAF